MDLTQVRNSTTKEYAQVSLLSSKLSIIVSLTIRERVAVRINTHQTDFTWTNDHCHSNRKSRAMSVFAIGLGARVGYEASIANTFQRMRSGSSKTELQ